MRKSILVLLLLPILAHAAPYADVSPGGLVKNIVNWDGVTTYNVSPDTLVATNGNPAAQPGGTYVAGTFTAPVPGAAVQGIVMNLAPTTGQTIQIPDAPQPQNKIYVILQPAAALAALTIVLPPNPQDGCDVYLETLKAITTVAVNASAGQGVINIPATFAFAAGVSSHITWSAQYSAWFRL